jgi:hypothetical protein
MKRQAGTKRTILYCAAGLLFSVSAQADELNGAWATDLSVCNKVFVTDTASVSFSKASESYGSGFIIEGNLLRGRMLNCTIQARKQDGNMIHLIAACSSDVALSPMQFDLRIAGENKVTRVFPGLPEMDRTYVRCP